MPPLPHLQVKKKPDKAHKYRLCEAKSAIQTQQILLRIKQICLGVFA